MVFFGLCLLVFLVLLCFLVVLVIVCLCVLLCLVLFWCSLVFCVCFWFLCLLLSSFLLLSLLFVSSVSVVCPSVFFGCLVLFWFLLIPSPCVCLCPCVPSLFGPFYALTVPLGFSCSWLVSSSLVCSPIFLCGICSALLFGVCVFSCFWVFCGVVGGGVFCGARCWGCVFLGVVWFLGCFGSFFVACFGVPCFLGGVGWGVFGVVRGSVGVLRGFCGVWGGLCCFGVWVAVWGVCGVLVVCVVYRFLGWFVLWWAMMWCSLIFLLVAGLLVLVVWCICFCVGGCVWFRVWMVFHW